MGFLPITKSIKKTDDPKNLIIFGLPPTSFWTWRNMHIRMI